MVTVCVETLSVVKNEKVLIEKPYLNKLLVYREKFKKIFVDEKQHELLIDSTLVFSRWHSSSEDDRSPALIFDIKKQRFRLKEFRIDETMLDHFGFISSGDPFKVTLVGRVLYAFYPQERATDLNVRKIKGSFDVATFRYEDCEMSWGKTVFESEDEDIVFDEQPFIESVCFV